jgi:nucleotide-binding universal stress UspA family protein
MFQRLLVPLDGSPRAEQALPVAARLAQATQATMILLQVIPTREETGWPTTDWSTRQLEQSRLEKERAYLHHLTQTPALANRAVTTRACIGVPAEQILAAVENEQADLLVLCSHGRTGLKRWALGSVAQKVARSSSVPVLVLQENNSLQQRLATPTPLPIRLMVALDGSPLAESTITPAAWVCAALSAPASGRLQLTRVLHLPSSFEYGQDDSVSRALKQETPLAQAYLQSIAQRIGTSELAALHLQVTSTIAHDLDVASTLLTIAELGEKRDGSNRSDVIAVATHGRSGIRRWVTGSITERLLSTSRLSFLVVRPPTTGAE